VPESTPSRRRSRDDDVVEITSAPQTRAAEQAGRQRRYLISMIVRTLCFVGAVAVGPGVLRWVLITGAVFLPYVAVLFANARADLAPGNPDLPTPDLSVPALGSGRSTDAVDGDERR